MAFAFAIVRIHTERSGAERFRVEEKGEEEEDEDDDETRRFGRTCSILIFDFFFDFGRFLYFLFPILL